MMASAQTAQKVRIGAIVRGEIAECWRSLPPMARREGVSARLIATCPLRIHEFTT
jgi:hypothetical protein